MRGVPAGEDGAAVSLRLPQRGQFRRRRGAAIAAIILLLAVLNLAAVVVLHAGAQESEIGAMRAQTVRALYAAESAATAVVRLNEAGVALPASGSTLTLTGATAQYTSVPAAGVSGTLDVVGMSGDASRRVRLDFQVQ